MIDKIRVKKISIAGNFSVWLVDGALVRKDINENFVKCGDNSHFGFISKNEFWIDEDLDPKEFHFFIDRFIYEKRLIDSGKNYHEADKIADVFENEERRNSSEVQRIIKSNRGGGDLSGKIKKKIFKKYSDSVCIWLVDGNLVRSLFLLDYCEGGHDKVYRFIPKNEIWIEQAISPKERQFIILHELHERYLMCQGKSYKNAHIGATEIEDYYRDHPEKIEERIKEEIQNNK